MDQIVLDGDFVKFDPIFAPAIVIVQPARIRASGEPADRGNVRKMCVQGDERSVIVPGCTYTSPPFTNPGMGTLTIEVLSPMSAARKTQSARRPVLLKGQRFVARFTVNMAATMVTGNGVPMPDPRPFYQGAGSFECTPPFVHGE